MKFIVESEQFNEELKSWAQDSSILTASFFFLRQGAPEQRSLNGALRTLLHQLVAARPEWMAFLPNECYRFASWSDKVLRSSLKAVIEHGLESVKVCFVLDGLDEMEDDADARDSLMSILHGLCQNSHTKILLSSRPDPYFRETLSSYKYVRLQDLTHADIQQYTQRKLSHNEQWTKLCHSDPRYAQLLVDEITARADGVFLWVYLAVSDILRGLQGRDDLDMLQDRLSNLHPTLHGLFSQLLKRIDRVHRTSSANILKLVIRRSQMQWLDSGRFSLMHLALALDERCRSGIQHMLSSGEFLFTNAQEVVDSLSNLEISFTVRSAGLLELIDRSQGSVESDHVRRNNKEDCVPSSDLSMVFRRLYHYYINVKVQLVHRSALDFLSCDDEAVHLMGCATLDGTSVDERIVDTAKVAAELALMIMHEVQQYIPSQSSILISKQIFRDVDEAFNREWALLMCTLKLSEADDTPEYAHNKLDTAYMAFNSMLYHYRVKLTNSRVFQLSWQRSLLHVAFTYSPECAFMAQTINERFISWACEQLRAEFLPECLSFLFTIVMERLLSNNPDQGWPCIPLIGRLVQAGLPVNANFLVRRLVRDEHWKDLVPHWPSIWELYLLWLHHLTLFNSFKPHKLAGPHQSDILDVTATFVENNADANAGVFVKQMIVDTQNSKSMVSFTIEMSARTLLEIICCLAGVTDHSLLAKLQAQGGNHKLSITSISAEAPHPSHDKRGYNFLQIPTRFEQIDLGQAYKAWLIANHGSFLSNMLKETSSALDAKVWEIWMSNIGCVERFDGSDLLECPSPGHRLTSTDTDTILFFPLNLPLKDGVEHPFMPGRHCLPSRSLTVAESEAHVRIRSGAFADRNDHEARGGTAKRLKSSLEVNPQDNPGE